MHPTRYLPTSCFLSLLAISSPAIHSSIHAQPGREIKADIELNEKNFTAWKKHILPAERDLKWQQIPWLNAFKDAVVAADSAGKPLLLWMMNGHPLGCT